MIGPLVSEIVILKLGIFVADYSSIGKINMGTRHTQTYRERERER